MKTPLSRRTVLRGILGGVPLALSLPLFEAALNANGTAYAAGDPLPKYFGTWFWGGGVDQSRWVPSTTGAGYTPSEELVPFKTAGVLEYVSIVNGTSFP